MSNLVLPSTLSAEGLVYPLTSAHSYEIPKQLVDGNWDLNFIQWPSSHAMGAMSIFFVGSRAQDHPRSEINIENLGPGFRPLYVAGPRVIATFFSLSMTEMSEWRSWCLNPATWFRAPGINSPRVNKSMFFEQIAHAQIPNRLPAGWEPSPLVGSDAKRGPIYSTTRPTDLDIPKGENYQMIGQWFNHPNIRRGRNFQYAVHINQNVTATLVVGQLRNANEMGFVSETTVQRDTTMDYLHRGTFECVNPNPIWCGIIRPHDGTLFTGRHRVGIDFEAILVYNPLGTN